MTQQLKVPFNRHRYADCSFEAGGLEVYMKVRDIMVKPVVTVREDTTLAEIAKTMLERRIGGLPVVNSEALRTRLLFGTRRTTSSI